MTPPVPSGDEEPLEVVASVGPLDGVVVLLREFLHRSGAVRAVAVVDRAPGEGPAVVDCGRLLPIEVDLGDADASTSRTASSSTSRCPSCRRCTSCRPSRSTRPRAASTSPVGGLQHVAESTRALAHALGGRNVALAQFATTDPGTPLAITARADDGRAARGGARRGGVHDGGRPMRAVRVACGLTFLAAGLNHFRVPEGLPVDHARLPARPPRARAGQRRRGGRRRRGAAAPAHARAAGWWLLATLAAVFPANVHMALHHDRYAQIPRWALVARLPFQLVFGAWVAAAMRAD